MANLAAPPSPSSWRLAGVVAITGVVVSAIVTVALARSEPEDPKRTLVLFGLFAGIAITSLSIALVVVLARGQQRSQAISERMTDRLADREHMLKQSERELDRFATIAAHDLQEPLRTILTFTDLVERRYGPTLEPEARDYIIRVAGAAARMRALIEDLLTYSRVGQAEREFETVDLATSVAEAIANVEPLILETDARIQVGELPTVVGNPQGLQQLFTNLLSNALKYRLGTTPRVRIEAKQQGKEWIVAVADNGKGIDPANHDRIFELFRRLEPRGVSGTGLGLAICARIVDVHGGKIWVKSDVGKGATFYVSIPVRTAPNRNGSSKSSSRTGRAS